MKKFTGMVLILAMIFVIAPLKMMADTASNNEDEAYTVEGITVTGNDGIEYPDFVPYSTLKEITLSKNNAEAFSGNLYVVFYDENQSLSSVFSEPAAFDEGTGSVIIDLSGRSIVLPENIRSYSIAVMLWDDSLVPVMNEYVRENLNKWQVYYNSELIRPDSMPIYKSNGDIHIGVKYILNLMGITLLTDDGSYSAVRDYDGAYIDFTVGNDTVKSSKGNFVLDTPAYLTNDCTAVLPLSILSDVFGCELAAVDLLNTKMYITYTESDYKYTELTSDYTAVYSTDIFSASYTLTVPVGTELSEVWYKPAVSASDSDFNNEEFNSSMDSRYWHKAAAPVKSQNTYTGSFSYLKRGTKYNIKYIVTENGVQKIFADTGAFRTNSRADAKSDLIYDAQTLTLTPTYENIGYYIDYDGASSCEITYRKTGESGWHKAYEPFNDTSENQFRGSIVKLEDNTEYEVKAVLKDSDGNIIDEQLADTVTWNNSPVYTAVSLEEYIGDFEVSDNIITEPIQLTDIEGSPDNWIKIDCSSYTVDAGCNSTAAVSIDGCRYVIVDGLTVKGGYRCGIAVNESCSDVRISGCDISAFGRTGVQGKNGWFYRDSTPINYDAGVLLLNGNNITIEDCCIHDAQAKTNPWQGSTWSSTHPYGSTGIYYCISEGCVIRNNKITGNETHRWNDGIEGWGNSCYNGGPSKDTDIYGNIITYGQDDGIELDGGQMNVRVYDNTISRFLCGFSIVPNLAGPSYFYENIIYDMGTECYTYGRAFKAGGSQNGSVSYAFNNTCFVNGVIVENSDYNGAQYNFVTRNNIFVNTRGGSSYKNTADGALNDNDYDFCYGNYINYSNGGHSKQYTAASNTEYVKINYSTLCDKLGFNDAQNGDFSLSLNSECLGAGVYIDNFCEIDSPNIGAIQ